MCLVHVNDALHKWLTPLQMPYTNSPVQTYIVSPPQPITEFITVGLDSDALNPINFHHSKTELDILCVQSRVTSSGKRSGRFFSLPHPGYLRSPLSRQ